MRREHKRSSHLVSASRTLLGASRRGSGSGTWVQVLPNPKPVSELMISYVTNQEVPCHIHQLESLHSSYWK